jgi:hypothetical protein
MMYCKWYTMFIPFKLKFSITFPYCILLEMSTKVQKSQSSRKERLKNYGTCQLSILSIPRLHDEDVSTIATHRPTKTTSPALPRKVVTKNNYVIIMQIKSRGIFNKVTVQYIIKYYEYALYNSIIYNNL